MTVRRGEVWWASIPELGDKPVAVVSADALNRALDEVLATRITAVERERGLPTYVELPPGEVDELEARSFILCHNVYTLPKSVLRRRAAMLPPLRMVEVERALRWSLDL